jgi:selenocysteine-specific elongation factor
LKLHIGTRRIAARTYLLHHTEGSPAAGQRVQLILERGVIAFAGDRFVLRDDNESTTLGGGVVIDPVAPQWGKSRSSRLRQLDALETGSPQAALQQVLFLHEEVVSLLQGQRIWNLSQEEMNGLLDQPPFGAESLVRFSDKGDERILSRAVWERYSDCLEKQLADWHSARPMEPGVRPEVLRSLAQPIPAVLFRALLDERIRAGTIVHQEQHVRALGHRPTLSPQVQREWQQLETQLQARGLNIPLRSELQTATGFDAKQLEALARPAIKAGELFEIGEKRLALPATLRELARRVHDFTGNSGTISVIEAKQAFGLGRNTTIEILEFFDHIGYTKRSGNARVVADPGAASLTQHKALT